MASNWDGWTCLLTRINKSNCVIFIKGMTLKNKKEQTTGIGNNTKEFYRLLQNEVTKQAWNVYFACLHLLESLEMAKLFSNDRKKGYLLLGIVCGQVKGTQLTEAQGNFLRKQKWRDWGGGHMGMFICQSH